MILDIDGDGQADIADCVCRYIRGADKEVLASSPDDDAVRLLQPLDNSKVDGVDVNEELVTKAWSQIELLRNVIMAFLDIHGKNNTFFPDFFERMDQVRRRDGGRARSAENTAQR